MGRTKDITVITPDYPYKSESVYPFVQNLCEAFVRHGYGVTVVVPQSITSAMLHRIKLRPKKRVELIEGKSIVVYQPYCLSVSFKHHDINNYLIRRSLKRFFRKNKLRPDFVYCHFWNSAFVALPFAKANDLPLFVATGESVIEKMFTTKYGYKELNDYVRGVICVSSKNKDESIKLGLTTEEKCRVFPNSVNADLFHKQSRVACRNKLGFSQDAFIVAFVGWFIERKGPKRVAEAIEKVGKVNSVFIGKGEQEPQCDGILFKGTLPHEDIPIYLGAADIFVLPTQNEGCCNAVVEAMACGLPVISSNLPFNWDVLDSSNSIMVNPNNVDEIAEAIKVLRDDKELRQKLAAGALEKSENLTIEKRAKAILDFMEERI